MNFRTIGHQVVNFDHVRSISFSRNFEGQLVAHLKLPEGGSFNQLGKKSEALDAWAVDGSEVVPITPIEDLTNFPAPTLQGTPKSGAGGSPRLSIDPRHRPERPMKVRKLNLGSIRRQEIVPTALSWLARRRKHRRRLPLVEPTDPPIRRVDPETLRVGLAEMAAMTDDPPGNDEAFFREIDEGRPHRPLFEGMY